LCGRYRNNRFIWFKGQASNNQVIIRIAGNEDVSNTDEPDENMSCDICGERCAAEYVAVWIAERELSVGEAQTPD
jgi:hypothetical protein